VSLRVGIKFESDLDAYAHSVHLRIARGARNAAERQAARAKVLLRQDVLQAGLGDKVADAWRADIYPKSASVHTHAPAVQVYSKAPNIVTGFGHDTLIRHHDGLYLALPTKDTPRLGRRYASPVEVEAIFNQDLIFFPGRGQQKLAFIDAVKAKSGKKWRRATSARTGKQKRKAELVLMFVMVRQVHLRKRLDWQDIFVQLGSEWRELFAKEVSEAINAGAN
jgi:hypothetical protein